MKKMKYIGYIPLALMSVAAIGLLADDNVEKVKPAQVAPPPAAQYWEAPVRQSLNGTADGVPDGLHLVGVDDKAVTLRWNNPEPMDGYFDDFEGHSDFVVNSRGAVGWDYLDMDNANTVTWAATSFPNQGSKMAFIVFNVARTSPSVADNPNIQPYSGDKMLATFAVLDQQNNDYLISPGLSFTEDFQISFRARSYNDTYGLERIRVGYSTTGKRASDFVWVSEGDYEEVPVAWTLKSYRIPKEAKYVTVNCVSDDAFMLFIDDLFIGTNQVRPKANTRNKLIGFNLYRNSEKVNSELLTEVVYTDEVPDYGDYVYEVSAVYADNSESARSETVSVNVPDIRLLPFEDDFSSWVLDGEKWSTPVDDKGNASKWDIDYYSYGLVDPCATYQFSSLANYSQSLVSRELHTPDRSNTYLRFDLRMLNYESVTGDTLSVEVSCDNNTWVEVESFLNDEGTYTWRQELIDLSPHLTSDLFRIRFRAHGIEASYIDYWYVDDIKIWNPQWTTAQLTVETGGSSFAGCPVTIVGKTGGRQSVVSGSDGTISFPQIEADVYMVTVDVEGYNLYEEEWEVLATGSNDHTITVTRPNLAFSTTDVHEELIVEEKVERTVTLTNSGDGEAMWRLKQETATGTGDISNRFKLQQSFNASGDLQSAIVFDGDYFYTSSWYNIGKFYKYDRNGEFIEEFEVEGMYYKLDDMAFDGTYFYGSDDTNTIYQLDLRNKRLVKTITIVDDPTINIAHIAYDPRSDEFWAGASNTICRINREGEITVSMRSISDTEDLDIYGSAYDDVTPGGPYLWLSHEELSSNGVDYIELRQYDLNTRRLTSVRHEVTDLPDYQHIYMTYGAGIETTTALVDGTLSLVGIMEQSPARIYVYELCRVDEWLSYSPKTGVLQPGESQEITIAFDARNGVVGESYSSHLKVYNIPELADDCNLTVGYEVTGPSATPRPVELSATCTDDVNVSLAWENGGSASTPSGYNVYRDGVKINTDPVTEQAYVDNNLIQGGYYYAVTALYGEQESNLSDSVYVDMLVGAPYFAPTGLTASVSQNKTVALSWEKPGMKRQTEAILRYDNGTFGTGVGLTDGGYFFAGIKWGLKDLNEYRGMQLDKVDVYVNDICMALSLRIYKDGKIATNQTLDLGSVVYGQFNTFELDNPVTIERGHEYMVCVLVIHDAGVLPIGMDEGTAVEGVSNLISTNGVDWTTCRRMGCGTGNLNIAAHFAPATDEEEAPAGYDVYRDEVKINSELVTDTQYVDEVTEPGVYAYRVKSVYTSGGTSAYSSESRVEILELGEPVAPSQLTAEVELNSKVRLRWNYPVEGEMNFPVDLNTFKVTAREGYPEYVSQFRGYIPNELAIVSDGEYVYSSLYSTSGAINKYSLDGEFLETIVIEGIESGIWNLAYDGEYFYATTAETSVYKIDMAQQTLVETLTISEVARHIAYIPELDNGRGGFEVGDWETSILVNKRGGKLATGPVYKGASGTAYFNGSLYAFEQGYENPYVLVRYDAGTNELVAMYDLSEYVELETGSGIAGGMSVVKLPNGLSFLALLLQDSNSSHFIFLDPGSLEGVEGYNVYCNGSPINETPIKHRAFEIDVTEPGEYEYAVQTVYIDGSVSALSQETVVVIDETGEGLVPTDVKAVQASCGYDVHISFADPYTKVAEVYESAEDIADGAAFVHSGWTNQNDSWTVTSAAAYEGDLSITSTSDDEAILFIPIAHTDGADKIFSFVARNADDRQGTGNIVVYTSTEESLLMEDFIQHASVSTTEAWKKSTFTLPESVRCVALKHAAGDPVQYIDAISMSDESLEQIYGYYVYRDGVRLNSEAVTTVSYTDHNLLPGTYTYQVSALYKSSAVSDLSPAVSVDVDYSNNFQAPGVLSVERVDEGVRLHWSAPALGDAVNLKWHSGTVHDAAGLPSGGEYFAGVQWTADELQPYESLSLSEVEVYVNQIPNQMFLLVYEGTDLVRMQYVQSIKQYSFNTIKLDTPLRINPNRSLRVAIYVEHNEISVPLGYDEGPARTGRGDLYSADGVTWETLTDNGIDGNWNITLSLRAYAEPAPATEALALPDFIVSKAKASVKQELRSLSVAETSSSLFAFDGYNVYRNGDKLTDEPISETTYLDREEQATGYYEYQVKAVYTGYGEVGSNVVRIMTSGIGDIESDGVSITTAQGNIYITGLHADEPVFVYDLSGRMIAAAVSNGNRTLCMDMSAVPESVYIVKTAAKMAKLRVTRR